MDSLQAKGAAFEVDHSEGAINLTIDSGENRVAVSLSVVEASQLVALLHKQINEAAVERLRTRGQ